MIESYVANDLMLTKKIKREIAQKPRDDALPCTNYF